MGAYTYFLPALNFLIDLPQCGRMKDRLAVTQILPTLIHCENDRAYSDTFLHCLTSYLIYMKEEFQNEEFVNAVLDEFFMVRL